MAVLVLVLSTVNALSQVLPVLVSPLLALASITTLEAVLQFLPPNQSSLFPTLNILHNASPTAALAMLENMIRTG